MLEQTETGLPSIPRAKSLGRVTRMLAAVAAGILILLAGAGALFQAPHPDPLRVTHSWDVANPDWWRYPVEQNAFKRLPVVRGDLRSVFVLPGTEQVWDGR